MRYSKEHKAETRKRVVEAAARRFRKEGIEATGVVELMADAGLTHGGFYAHFPSKESLVREAVLACSAQRRERMQARIALARAEQRDPLEQVVRHYLTITHRDHPEKGCSIASLGTEIARHPRKTRDAFSEGFEQLIALIVSALPDPAHPDARQTAYGVFSTMMGALQLSRVLPDPKLSETALDAGIEAALAVARGAGRGAIKAQA